MSSTDFRKTFSQLEELQKATSMSRLMDHSVTGRLAREFQEQQEAATSMSRLMDHSVTGRLAREFQEQQEAATSMSRLMDHSVTGRLAREFQEQQESARKMFRLVDDSVTGRLAREFQKQQEAATSMSKLMDSAIGRLAIDQSVTAKLARDFQEQHELATRVSTWIDSVTGSLAREFQEATNIKKLFGSSFVASSFVLQAHSASFIDAVENGLFDEMLEGDSVDENATAELLLKLSGISRYITEYLVRLVKSHKPNVWEVIGIVLAVLSWLDSNVADDKTRQMFKEEIAKTQTKIISSIADFDHVTTPSYESCVVVHPSSIRVKPSHKSASISSVYKNQVITVLLSKREWAYVQYFDYIEAIPKTGWVAKKYISRVKVSASATNSSTRP